MQICLSVTAQYATTLKKINKNVPIILRCNDFRNLDMLFFVYILDNETDHNLPSRGKQKKTKKTKKENSNCKAIKQPSLCQQALND